jgi:hypothetical protein
MAAGRQPPRDQRGVGQLADADRQIVPLADEIDVTVVEVEVDLELGMPDQKLGDRRREVQVSERHRGGDPQGAPKLALETARRLLGFDDVGQDVSRPLVIGVPRFGEAQAARGAVKKAGPEPVFECTDPPADHRFSKPQPARGTRETLGLDRSHKDGHLLEEAHQCSAFANNLLQK